MSEQILIKGNSQGCNDRYLSQTQTVFGSTIQNRKLNYNALIDESKLQGIEIGKLESKKIIDSSTTLLKIKLISNPLHSNIFGVIKL